MQYLEWGLQGAWISFDWVVVVKWQGGISGTSIINFQVPTRLRSVYNHHPIPGQGSWFLHNNPKVCIWLLCIFLEEDCPITELLFKLSFLIAFPLFLHIIISLSSNHLSLLFETQGRYRRVELFSTNKKRWGIHRGFCTWDGLTESCSISIPLFLWCFSILRGAGARQDRQLGFE